MAYQTFTHQIWWVMVCYDLAHQIRCAKHTFSGWCDIPPMVCCSFCGHSTPQFLQCRGADKLHRPRPFTDKRRFSFAFQGTVYYNWTSEAAPHWGVQSRFRVIYIYVTYGCPTLPGYVTGHPSIPLPNGTRGSNKQELLADTLPAEILYRRRYSSLTNKKC